MITFLDHLHHPNSNQILGSFRLWSKVQVLDHQEVVLLPFVSFRTHVVSDSEFEKLRNGVPC